MESGQDKQKFGEPLEDFSLSAIGGGTVSLGGRLEGKKGSVVVFWSGTCSHCVRYDSYLNAFEEKYPDLSLIAIASRHGETPEMIRATMAKRNLTFTMVHDPGSLVARKWFTQQTPRAFLVDHERRLHYRGAIDNYKYPVDPEHVHYLGPAVDEFLKGEPVSRKETASYGCAIFSVYYILPKAL
jgi:thiol-disulfide isomerase/thioredoxin